MNINTEINMLTVYIVAGGSHYAGEYMDSVQVFTNREDALRRLDWLTTAGDFDYAVIEERMLEVPG
jgi:hypothetical protein